MPRGERWRPFIVAASFVFYAGWDWRFCFLLAVLDRCGTRSSRSPSTRRRDARARKWLLLAALAGNLGLLGYFKYYDFFVTSTNNLFAFVGVDVPLEARSIVLPVGISFFTFMGISYVVDVYRGDFEPTGLGKFAAYLSFFPHLVAGPIVRPGELIPQLDTPRDPRYVDTSRAFFLIGTGLFMKVVIANYLAANIVDEVFGAPNQHSSLEVLVGIYAYAVQIYADFFGYTNMAIGLALLLGFRSRRTSTPRTRRPRSTDFWRRWHMTLSRWLRDYLYIPLGGNRGGTLFTYRNLMLTMLIGGLWHGAGWTFVAWGAIHGAALVARALVARAAGFVERPWTRRRRAWQRFVTFQVVCFAWIFFRSDSFADAWDLIVRLFTAWGEPSPLVTGGVLAAIAVGIGSQYLPRRLPLVIMARFSRLPIPAQAASSRSRSSSRTPWDRRAWHRSSTSSSDGHAGDTETQAGAGEAGEGGPAPALRRVGDRRLARGPRVALLLNAPGLHKSATIQPEGWKRDVALAVTGPLESVSGALLLDQPRRALKAALGRSDDDEIDTAVAVPEAAESPPETRRPPRLRSARSSRPRRPLRLWIAGDSLVVVPGESILRAVAEQPRDRSRRQRRRPHRERSRAAGRLQLVHLRVAR